MELRRLRIHDVRLIEDLDLELGRGWNFFVGANGAGKTTLLEAAFLLSHARSFRSGAREALARSGTTGYSVFGEIERADGARERIGVARNGSRLEARVDGSVVTIGDLLARAAVVCFEPGSHELISGGAEVRRRFLDWGVFHVEPLFLTSWRRYQRALKQRNALLRAEAGDAELDAWDRELAAAATPLDEQRSRYSEEFKPLLEAQLQALLTELGTAQFTFQSGTPADLSLIEVLAERRGRDRARGYTSAGPHRADWQISFEHAPQREYLSRGQEKLCAFACVIAQARLFADHRGEWPVVALDDVASELDVAHHEIAIATVAATGAQVLATGTVMPSAFAMHSSGIARFHVEQGRVTGLL